MRHEVDDETRRELFEDDDSRGGDERWVEWGFGVEIKVFDETSEQKELAMVDA